MLRERLIDTRSLGPRRRGKDPEPPFHKLATDVLWVGFRIDTARVAPTFPLVWC